MLARPTKSKVLFYQCIGRGLRLSPTTGKEDCLLIDAVGATKRHNILSVAAELGLLVATTPQERLLDGEAQEGEGQEAEKPTSYHAHDIDLTQRTRLHWVETLKGYWVVSLADRMLRVRPDGQGTYRLEVRQRDEKVYTCLADRLSQAYCFGIASDTARDAHLLHLVREGAQWREKPRSEKQEAFAAKLGITIQPDWRSGEVADAITAHIGDWYDASMPPAPAVPPPMAPVSSPWCTREGRCQHAAILRGRCGVCKKPRKLREMTGTSNEGMTHGDTETGDT
jgi:hypothetical protein